MYNCAIENTKHKLSWRYNMDNWDSEHYKQHALAQESAALKILKNINLQGNERILDIGCGDGKITEQIAKNVPNGEVIGIDSSPNMIKQATSDYSHIPNLKFLREKAETFTFKEKFDLVTSFFALHWVKDHSLVLKNILSALKKGGRIVLLMVSGGDPLIGEVFERDPWKSLIQKQEEKYFIHTENEYHNLLNLLGFIENRVETVELTHQFSDIEELTQQFMTWVPFATGLHQDQSLQFSREIAENIALDQGVRTNINLISSMLFVDAHL